jgi:hypothetical protein
LESSGDYVFGDALGHNSKRWATETQQVPRLTVNEVIHGSTQISSTGRDIITAYARISVDIASVGAASTLDVQVTAAPKAFRYDRPV